MAGPARNARDHGQGTHPVAWFKSFFGGQFGRMFRALPPADFGVNDIETEKNLLALGAAMIADHDDPKDGPDQEESGIPAAYTYLGQFVDHDLTSDPGEQPAAAG